MTGRRQTDRRRSFGADERGAATLEFVIVFGPLIILFFFIIEMAFAYHWAIAAQKGVENGVRVAVVQAPVHSDLLDPGGGPARVRRVETAVLGDEGGSCAAGNCVTIADETCQGGTLAVAECSTTDFQKIFQAVSRLAYGIAPEDVSITYRDVNLGYAGEPYVPLVTVRIEPRAFALDLNLFGGETTLPGYEASLVAEDLSN
ncbi:MAG: TadE family protein [Pseudomonadota bacterium]